MQRTFFFKLLFKFGSILIKIKPVKKLHIFTALLCMCGTLVAQSDIQKSRSHSYDYSQLSWTDAVDSLSTIMAERYAFTEWKAIDWNEKILDLRPKIEEAEENNDSVAFFRALQQYLFSVPDGHISILNLPDYYKTSIAGGTFGFNMCPVDDGSVLVSVLVEGSDAWIAGMRTGDKILKWNGVNIDEIGELENLNTFSNYATIQSRLYSRYLMLGRDSIGAMATITYSSSDNITHQVDITAVDDNMELLRTGFFNTVTFYNSDSIVTYNILENNIGYFRIQSEMAPGETIDDILAYPDFIKMENAIKYFNENHVEKLIVDLRLNNGGNDLQAAVSMGLFFETPSLYEYITATCDNNYEVIHTLYTEPLSTLFTGEIAVLVDPNCISTGEGMAMMFNRLENAHIVSHWGTNGSFGMVDWEPVAMPLGIAVNLPQARSLNENMEIQIDSDSTLKGGIDPDIKVPLNREAIIQQWQNGVDVQLEYAKGYLLSTDECDFNSDLQVYPIPCSDILTVRSNSSFLKDSRIAIYNLSGDRLIYEKASNQSNTFMVDVSNFRKGLYFYNISKNSKNVSGKFMVN